MTYVQYVNCDKWKKVIGISLWIGASIGLAYLTNSSLGIWGKEIPGLVTCDVIYDDKNMDFRSSCNADYSKQGVIIGSMILLNLINYFMIWRTMNNHYQWLEIRCGSKPDNTSQRLAK